MASWYRRIPPKRSKTERLRSAMNAVRGEVQRYRKPPTIRNDKFVFYRTYSHSLFTGGYRTKVCTRYHMAKFFEVELSTIHRWGKTGVLPKPFMIMERGQRNDPVYLSAQFRVLVIVVRDLVADGYVTMPWHLLDEHIKMLHEGYDEAAKNHRSRMDEGDPLQERAGKFGVIFDD